MRLSELASLDVGDIDVYSETVRVFGKGRKERICPIGGPALRRCSAIAARPACMTGRCSAASSGRG